MALLFAHITFQIRRGFRSRIFFELKILTTLLFMAFYDALRRNQLLLWQHRPSPLFLLPGEEDSLIDLLNSKRKVPFWEGIKRMVKVSRVQIVISIIDTPKNNQFHKTRTISNPCH